MGHHPYRFWALKHLIQDLTDMDMLQEEVTTKIPSLIMCCPGMFPNLSELLPDKFAFKERSKGAVKS